MLTNGNDACGELPCRSARTSQRPSTTLNRLLVLEGIGYPVCNKRGDAPFPRVSRDGIKVFVRPNSNQFTVGAPQALNFSAHHLLLPSAKAEFGCSTLRCGRENFMIGLHAARPRGLGTGKPGSEKFWPERSRRRFITGGTSLSSPPNNGQVDIVAKLQTAAR